MTPNTVPMPAVSIGPTAVDPPPCKRSAETPASPVNTSRFHA